MTLPSVDEEMSFWERGRIDPSRMAMVDPDGRRWRYWELVASSNRVANGLRARGLGRGDVIAVVAPNGHEVFEILSAALQTGLYYLPINVHFTGSEIAYILRDAGAKALFAHQRFAQQAMAAAREVGIPDHRKFVIECDLLLGAESYELFKDQYSASAPGDRCPGQRLYYTSGTTGRPKGVLKDLPVGDPDSVGLRWSRAHYANNLFPPEVGLVHLVAGPVYHGAPLGCGMAALHRGQTVVVMGTEGRWSAQRCLSLLASEGVHSVHLVPTMFHRMLQLPEAERASYDLSNLRAVSHAAAPCAPEVKTAMIDWLGPIVSEYYAASEGAATKVTSQEWLARPGTVGRPIPGADVRILDELGQPVAAGTPGTAYLLLTEPFEYLNDPAKTAASRRGEYFTVGDIGYLDEDGYLFLCERDSEVIIAGGVNIYPSEVEAVLLGHPAVSDVAVVGIPNAEYGEEVKAVVELCTGYAPTDALADDLLVLTRTRLPPYKCPRSVDFTDALPRLDSGKLYKRKVRNLYWEGRGRRI